MKNETLLKVVELALESQKLTKDESWLMNDITYSIIFELLDQQDVVKLLLDKYSLQELIDYHENK